jgi:SAM-dependent methyltransferase
MKTGDAREGAVPPAPSQHQVEIQQNLAAWQRKPILKEIYSGFYESILRLIDPTIPGHILELGSGIGNLKQHLPQAIASDLFANPWLDLVCDAYHLPFRDRSISHLILFDVFHHLRYPMAFLKEARRVLNGRLILFEPFISWTSFPVYGLFHHEPIAWREPIDGSETVADSGYYAAQGNATRMFFRDTVKRWRIFHAEALSAFHYLLSGGFSKPPLYPRALLRPLKSIDALLSRWPHAFGARCLIGLTPA